jgi:hypothetical protein
LSPKAICEQELNDEIISLKNKRAASPLPNLPMPPLAESALAEVSRKKAEREAHVRNYVRGTLLLEDHVRNILRSGLEAKFKETTLEIVNKNALQIIDRDSLPLPQNVVRTQRNTSPVSDSPGSSYRKKHTISDEEIEPQPQIKRPRTLFQTFSPAWESESEKCGTECNHDPEYPSDHTVGPLAYPFPSPFSPARSVIGENSGTSRYGYESEYHHMVGTLRSISPAGSNACSSVCDHEPECSTQHIIGNLRSYSPSVAESEQYDSECLYSADECQCRTPPPMSQVNISSPEILAQDIQSSKWNGATIYTTLGQFSLLLRDMRAVPNPLHTNLPTSPGYNGSIQTSFRGVGYSEPSSASAETPQKPQNRHPSRLDYSSSTPFPSASFSPPELDFKLPSNPRLSSPMYITDRQQFFEHIPSPLYPLATQSLDEGKTRVSRILFHAKDIADVYR